ncbi:MAG: hypothetical protein ACKOWL_03155 [Sphingobacteriaceae bacterium]
MENSTKENFFEKVKAYIQVRTRLSVLIATEKLAQFYASLVSKLLVLLCLALAFLFGSLALAFYLGDVLESVEGGFLAVMGIYLALAALLFMLKKPLIERPLIDKTINQVLGDSREEEEYV